MSLRARCVALLLLSLASASASAFAEPLAYVAGFDTLYRLDLATGTRSTIGPIHFSDVEGLAFSPDGILYGVADASKSLITIDVHSGHGTLVGDLGIHGQGVGAQDALDFGLTFDCSGELLLSSDTTAKLWRVNRGTGATSDQHLLSGKITGLAARAGEVYGLSAEDGHNSLYRIDPTAGTATLIGPLGVATDGVDGDLAFDSQGTLWGVIDYSPTQPTRPSDIVRIDPISGHGSLVAHTDPETEALAIVPPQCVAGGPAAVEIPLAGVPQLILFAGLLVLLAGTRLRLRRLKSRP
jgi:hypothetical protein